MKIILSMIFWLAVSAAIVVGIYSIPAGAMSLNKNAVLVPVITPNKIIKELPKVKTPMPLHPDVKAYEPLKTLDGAFIKDCK